MTSRSLLATSLIVALTLASVPSNRMAFASDAVASPEEVGFDRDRLQRVTKVFQGYVDSGQLPGAVVLIARNGKVAYQQAFGYQDREQNAPMAMNSIFRIASMTKPLVSVGVMMLVEEGKLDISAPVFQYLPELKDLKVGTEKRDPASGNTELVLAPAKRPMMVHDLLRHTAGLVYAQFGDGAVHKAYREANVLDRAQTSAEMITKLSKLPLAHQPGEVWEYSVATDVLGRIIEVVSGMTLDAFLEERITKPLGMNSTGFYVSEADAVRVAQPQVDPMTKERPAMFDPTKKPNFFSGGGGLVSTAGDYLKFADMLLNHGAQGDVRLLAPATIKLMTSNALPPGVIYTERAWNLISDLSPMPAAGQGFGLGLAIRTSVGQNPVPGSVGTFYWTGAFGTTFWIDPAEKMIGIMMIQVPLANTAQYRRAMKYLAYQALRT